jgi:hypothetical protein
VGSSPGRIGPDIAPDASIVSVMRSVIARSLTKTGWHRVNLSPLTGGEVFFIASEWERVATGVFSARHPLVSKALSRGFVYGEACSC